MIKGILLSDDLVMSLQDGHTRVWRAGKTLKDLTDLRSLNEMERGLHGRRELKMKNKIKALKTQRLEMLEKMAERETEIVCQINEEQRKERESAAALQKERTVREELIRIIVGQEPDMELLKGGVTSAELSSIRNAASPHKVC
jgi:hypothetical protein